LFHCDFQSANVELVVTTPASRRRGHRHIYIDPWFYQVVSEPLVDEEEACDGGDQSVKSPVEDLGRNEAGGNT